MKKQKEVCRAVAVAEAQPVEPDVLHPLGKIEEPDYTKPAERISFHIGMGQHHGRMALAHLILAGWELAQQKNVLGYGGWKDWCKKDFVSLALFFTKIGVLAAATASSVAVAVS